MQSEETASPTILLVEAFYGGSHKQLIDLLQENLPGCSSWSLPAKKWHWRARTAALYFSQTIPVSSSYRVLFCSSVLNLCELVALRPDLARLKKVLYFHENQLVYPVRKDQDRDFQYGYNQVLSCLVSDVVVFNSSFNMESFLSSISSFMKQIPDHRPQGLDCIIRAKSLVLSFPLQLPDVTSLLPEHKQLRQTRTNPQSQHTLRSEEDPHQSRPGPELQDPHQSRAGPGLEDPNQSGTGTGSDPDLGFVPGPGGSGPGPHPGGSGPSGLGGPHPGGSGPGPEPGPPGPEPGPRPGPGPCPGPGGPGPGSLPVPEVKPLHIVWPHRWEHDKNPELFFNTLFKLKDEGLQFNVSVLGETFTQVPEIFSSARLLLSPHLLSWGFQSSRTSYLKVLCEADVVVSTSRHEFFGVAMLEAVHCGCFPLCPKALVYPEIFPDQYLYSTPQQLFKRLRELCKKPQISRSHTVKVDMSSFSWTNLRSRFQTLLTNP